MRNWFSRHPVSFMAFYLLFYLSAFHWLEVHIAVPDVLVHCHLDDLIPFCKYAIVPYFAWFVWIPFTLFYLLWKAPRADFWRLCLPLFAGMTIALACYVILPTGLEYNKPVAGKRYRAIGKAMQVPGIDNMTDEEAADATIAAVKQLSLDVGIPQNLNGILKEEDVAFLSQSAYADACCPGNPRDTSEEEIAQLYKSLL